MNLLKGSPRRTLTGSLLSERDRISERGAPAPLLGIYLLTVDPTSSLGIRPSWGAARFGALSRTCISPHVLHVVYRIGTIAPFGLRKMDTRLHKPPGYANVLVGRSLMYQIEKGSRRRT